MPDHDSSTPDASSIGRRSFLKKTGVASALAGVAIPHVHAANGDETIRLAVVGCGGRGTGAIRNAMVAFRSPERQGDIRLHAMADVYEEKIKASYAAIEGAGAEFAARLDVPEERRFVGFNAYREAIDTLRPGDVVIFTTPCAFRWVHYGYAIEKGVNVFMEKPLCPDGGSGRRLLALNEKAIEKGLKVGVGLMVRHCARRGELLERVQDGEMGDIVSMRSYRMQGPIVTCFSERNPGGMSDLQYQMKRFHSFLWLSGGSVSDFSIHNIDECCWFKGAWPVKARASGGRHFRENYIDQNFDSYAIEYTFPDGTALHLEQRNMIGCEQKFASYAHGTKGVAVITNSNHTPSLCRLYKGQQIHSIPRRSRKRKGEPIAQHPDLIWAAEQPEPNPYDLEWVALIDAIQNGTKYNEVQRGVEASVVTAMGRMAAHTGQSITYDQCLNSEHEMSPNTDKLTSFEDLSPLPVLEDGSYPIPVPGEKKDREY